MDIASNYHSLAQSIWIGRSDSLPGERFFQITQCIDLRQQLLTPAQGKNDYALLGFCSDEGVRRNFGRIGAMKGPNAIRQAMANLATHNQNLRLFDVGNIVCENNDLEYAQWQLAKLVTHVIDMKYQPIVLGGGHEIAWANYQGIREIYPQIKLGIINFDAHFDLRPLSKPGYSTSGTSFTQIAEDCKNRQQEFSYLCIGIQPAANTSSLYNAANKLRVQTIDANIIRETNYANNCVMIDEFISNVDAVYLTVCMDVFTSAYAPGVSAPQALGLTPCQVLPLLKHVVKSGKVLSFDIAELAPDYDQQNRTALLAAQLIYHYTHGDQV